MKALGLVVSDKKIFENCILKTYFLTQWPTYATNQNYLNNFGRGPPRDHFYEFWSKSNEWFQRRRCLSKKVNARRTTDDGQRPVTIAHPEHFVLRWAKKGNNSKIRQGRVIVLMDCTSTQWDLSTNKVSCLYLLKYRVTSWTRTVNSSHAFS